MDNQPLTPASPTPFSTPSRSASGGPFLIILVIILGLGAVIFGALTITFYSKAATATNTLTAQKAAAAAQARADQQKADEIANTLASESPFRSYTAPTEFGAFEIKFPKNWSSTVDQEPNGTQVNLVLNPDFVRRISGTDELMGARITLQERPSDQFLNSFAGSFKNGKLKQTKITVSGLGATDITGSFPDKRTTREVVVAVRDKVLVFINENGKYATEFNEILAQAKIIP